MNLKKGTKGVSLLTKVPPVTEEIIVKSTTTAQTITPSTGKDAISKVTVNPIKIQDKTIDPDFTSKDTIVVTKDANYDYLDQVSINKDTDLVADNIKKDVNIFGITGTYEGGGTATPTLEDLTVTPTKQQQVFTHTNSDGYDNVTVAAIPSNYIEPTGTLQITENGMHDVTNYANVNANITAQAVYSPRYICFYQCPLTDLTDELAYLNTSNVTNMSYMFYGAKATSLDLSNFNTLNVTNMSYMFYGAKATSLDLSNFNTLNVTNMNYMFYGAKTEIKGLEKFNTSKVTNMQSMFQQSKVTTLDLSSFDTSKVTMMSSMFYASEITEIKGLENFDFSCVINLNSLFSASNVQEIDLSGKDFSSISAMGGAFASCPYLKTLNLSDTSWPRLTTWGLGTSFIASDSSLTTITMNNARFPLMGDFPPFREAPKLESINFAGMTIGKLNSMNQAFNGLTVLKEIDLSGFDTSNVTTFKSLFYNCKALNTINLEGITTPKCTDMYYVFCNCKSLTNLDLSLWETQSVKDMRSMFQNCSSLQNLDIRKFDFTSVTSYSNMFSGVPTDCKIIVKDDTAKEWITSKFTTLTNVVTVAELETE